MPLDIYEHISGKEPELDEVIDQLMSTATRRMGQCEHRDSQGRFNLMYDDGNETRSYPNIPPGPHTLAWESGLGDPMAVGRNFLKSEYIKWWNGRADFLKEMNKYI